MSEFVEAPFKLGFRNEGEFVNAYFMGVPSTLDDPPLLLGSMRKSMMALDDEIWERWKAVMKDAFAMHVKHATGLDPVMPERPAPESERTNSGVEMSDLSESATKARILRQWADPQSDVSIGREFARDAASLLERLSARLEAAEAEISKHNAEFKAIGKQLAVAETERDAQSAQLKRAREALERLIPRFEACAHAHGNDRDVVKDASSDARAVLSDLQGSK